jgi:hypothetical protein
MSNAVIYDYFSFMSDKSDKSDRKAAPSDPRAPAKPIVHLAVAERVQQSQIEVTESTLSDTVIERMFKRPDAG